MYRSTNLYEDREKFSLTARESYLSHALYDAILDQDLWNVLYLLREKKANPNCVLEGYGVAPIHCATGIGDEKCGYQMTSLCLKHEGDPNVRCSDGMTPVMIAALWNRPRVLILLIEKGGDVCLTDCDGKTAFDFAKERQNVATYSILMANLSARLSSTLDSWLSVSDNSSSDSLKTCLSEVSQPTLTSAESLKNWADTGFRKFDEDFSDIDSEFSFLEVFYPDNALLKRSLSEPCLFTSTPNLSGLDSDSGLDIFAHSASKISYSDSCDAKNSSFGSLSSCPTDNLKERLKSHGLFLGPVIKSTKRVYQYQLKKMKAGRQPTLTDTTKGVNEVLSSTFGDRLEEKMLKWSYLEREMSLYFHDLTRGTTTGKEFYTYLLLDPFVTNNLPARAKTMKLSDQWEVFIDSIFYVGKGKNARVCQHLIEAIKFRPEYATKKLRKIQEIFEKNGGVICLQVFLNLSSLEAHAREAAMIDALGGCQLTNEQSGRYYGLVDKWSLKQKRQLGVFLLFKCLQAFINQGERQIFQKDVDCKKTTK